MDIISLLTDFNVPYWEKGKNVSPGWIGVQCPFCDDASNHLGFNLSSGYWRCWRCGFHPAELTISKLLNVSTVQAELIMKRYDLPVTPHKEEETKNEKPFTLPFGTGPLAPNHKRYLERRDFDAEQLESEWSLKGTGPSSRLDGINFRFRIIIPVIWNIKTVSFTSRDITGKHQLRYISCPKEREIIHHKNILYGQQRYWGDSGICVEGPADAWRFGRRSFATFGIEVTPLQIREMCRVFRRIAVIFDNEPQAVISAEKLVSELRFRKVEAFRIDIKNDPGSMIQSEADYLIKQLIK